MRRRPPVQLRRDEWRRGATRARRRRALATDRGRSRRRATPRRAGSSPGVAPDVVARYRRGAMRSAAGGKCREPTAAARRNAPPRRQPRPAVLIVTDCPPHARVGAIIAARSDLGKRGRDLVLRAADYVPPRPNSRANMRGPRSGGACAAGVAAAATSAPTTNTASTARRARTRRRARCRSRRTAAPRRRRATAARPRPSCSSSAMLVARLEQAAHEQLRQDDDRHQLDRLELRRSRTRWRADRARRRAARRAGSRRTARRSGRRRSCRAASDTVVVTATCTIATALNPAP